MGGLIMSHKPRVLFLDDEESIRATLPLMLEAYGFTVTPTGTVPEALRLISHEKFDVLIADLNVGNAGDGFTVVSAMRRTQPSAVNFILTGYPAFETALEAIRQQVDDYLIKPTDIESLVQTIQSKLTDRKPTHGIQPRRLPDIIEQHLDTIVEHWLTEVKKTQRLAQFASPIPTGRTMCPACCNSPWKGPGGGSLPQKIPTLPNFMEPSAASRVTPFPLW
jgi:DNA-binding NtrC family response regulator